MYELPPFIWVSDHLHWYWLIVDIRLGIKNGWNLTVLPERWEIISDKVSKDRVKNTQRRWQGMKLNEN